MFASTFLEIRVLGGLAVCATAIAVAGSDASERIFRPIERVASKLATRRAVCCIGIAAIVLAARIGLLSIWSIPRPQIQDEFAYLLGGKTLALGRLTNPSPKYWQFFEAPHILVTPSFQGRYPPGQAIALAAGQILLGHPWFGVLLSCAAMAASICWMLQGWMPARWALLGALLSLIRLSFYSYWMNSYWGGAVAAIGGCLVMGAYPRIVRRGQHGYAWAMGAGLIILGITRPLEGAVSSLPVGIALLYWLFGDRNHATRRVRLIRSAAPLVLSLTAGAAFIGYYNYRVTGHVLRLPHSEYAGQYQHSPMLLAGHLDDRKIIYANPDMEYQQAVWEPDVIRTTRTHYLRNRCEFAGFGDHEALGFLLAIPLLMMPLTIRDRRIRLVHICLAIMLLQLLVANAAALHYAAPQTGAFFGLLVQCIRHLRTGARGRMRAVGVFLSRTLPIASVICFVGFGISRGNAAGWKQKLTPIQHRPEIETKLAADSHGKAIVFVRYQFDPKVIFPFEDWNYNSPDLEGTPVLWVHDMGRTENEKMLREYPGRMPWYCNIDYSHGPETEPVFSRY